MFRFLVDTMAINWNLAGWIIRSKNRPEVLKVLTIPQNPSRVAKKLKISLTHASKTVRELNSKNLIKCLNDKNKVGRIYGITEEGKEILKYIEKIEKK